MTRKLYLIGAGLGALIPYYFLLQFLRANGPDMALFLSQATANPVAKMLTADLIISSLVFFLFLFNEGRKLHMKRLWLYVPLYLAVGLSLVLALFLYIREGALERQGRSRGFWETP